MLDLKGKSISLIGFGESNKALYRFFTKKGIKVLIRSKEDCSLPSGQGGVFGDGYLDTDEDIIFRSPGVHPRLIKGKSTVYTEVGFGLERARCKKIAVTGSDGKTTTATLIHQMLNRGGKNALLGGNIGKPIVEFSASLSRDDYLVTELSSFQLMDMCPYLDVAVVTNVSQNHLDWHADMDEYICAKRNITKNATLAVLNYDDLIVRDFECKKKIYFSLENQLDRVNDGWDFVHLADGKILYNKTEILPLSQVRLSGEYNLRNVMSAIGATYGIIDRDKAALVAKEFCGVGGRSEEICKIDGVTYVNSPIDTTPSRTKSTLSAYPLNRVVAILGGYDKNLDYECLKTELSQLKALVLCGENKEKIRRVASCHTICVNTLDEGVSACRGLATDGDYVVLTPASASFDMFKNYKEKGRAFERAVLLLDRKRKK